jgi:hypothetical protein
LNASQKFAENLPLIRLTLVTSTSGVNSVAWHVIGFSKKVENLIG